MAPPQLNIPTRARDLFDQLIRHIDAPPVPGFNNRAGGNQGQQARNDLINRLPLPPLDLLA
jgi:hypothetical protein